MKCFSLKKKRTVDNFSGRKFDNTHKNFNFNKTRFNTYKYGLITKVDIRRRIDRMKRLRDEVPFDPKYLIMFFHSSSVDSLLSNSAFERDHV